MANIRKTFDCEIDIDGARVVVLREPLSSACQSDNEVDFEIQALKANLDEIAKKMKLAIQKQKKAALSLEIAVVSRPTK